MCAAPAVANRGASKVLASALDLLIFPGLLATRTLFHIGSAGGSDKARFALREDMVYVYREFTTTKATGRRNDAREPKCLRMRTIESVSICPASADVFRRFRLLVVCIFYDFGCSIVRYLNFRVFNFSTFDVSRFQDFGLSALQVLNS